MDRNVNIVKDVNGNNIVIINDIRFKGKRSVKWNDVKEYLEEFVGEFYEIADTKDVVYIGSDLPDEYTSSKPVFLENGEVERYNVFHASMLIRCANDGRLYLYDILEIKKRRATLWNLKILLGKNPFLFVCYLI